jgi:hypothetical protein
MGADGFNGAAPPDRFRVLDSGCNLDCGEKERDSLWIVYMRAGFGRVVTFPQGLKPGFIFGAFSARLKLPHLRRPVDGTPTSRALLQSLLVWGRARMLMRRPYGTSWEFTHPIPTLKRGANNHCASGALVCGSQPFQR